ncbi:hypothetical protein KBD81_01740 [Candidatus Woesebacteria bacterium]|nr:hypothetical protein [Candidatus Woesebacteria bacterium]
MEENSPYGPVTSSEMISAKPKNQHNMRMIMITVIVVSIALGGYVILSNESLKARMQESLNLKQAVPQQNTAQQEAQLFTSEIKDRAIPWIEIQAPESAAVGQEVEVTVNAFSGSKDISGYDMLLGIDPMQWEVVSIRSASPDFQIQQFDRGMYHSVTAYKNLEIKTPTVFENTPILNLTLKAKNTGEQLVTVMGANGQEKTQFIDKDVTVIEPQVGSTFISVQ